MKIKKIVLSLFLMVLFNVFTIDAFANDSYKKVDAYMDYPNRPSSFFGSERSGDRLAVEKDVPSTLKIYFNDSDLFFRSDWENLEAFVSYGQGWQPATAVGNALPFLEIPNLSFSEVGNYPVDVYLRNSSGVDYLYDEGEIWVFDREGVVTETEWLGATQTSRHDMSFYSPVIRAASGRQIAGFEYELDYCELLKEDGSSFTPMCLSSGMTPEGMELEYVNFGRTSYGGWVFDEGLVSGMRFWSRAYYHEDCGAYCQLKTRMPSLAAMSVFTRPEGNYPVSRANPDDLVVDGNELTASNLWLGSSSVNLDQTLSFGFDIKASGDKISDVYLKLGDLVSGDHLVSNMLSSANVADCLGKTECDVRGSWFVDKNIVNRYIGKELSVWLVIKTEGGLVCSDKPGVAGVSAPACGAGVKTIVVRADEKLPTIVLPTNVISPPIVPMGEIDEVVVEPTPTIVEKIVAVVEERIVRPVRKTAAQIIDEYFTSQQNQVVSEPEVVVTEPEEVVVEEVDDSSTITIGMPWELFR